MNKTTKLSKYFPSMKLDVKMFKRFIKGALNNVFLYFLFFFFDISSTFISNTRLKLVKNQTKAKQHSEAELLLLENYSLSSSTLSSKNINKVI